MVRDLNSTLRDPTERAEVDHLSHMLEAARLAREYVENTVKADFLNDRRIRQAVVLNLTTIGEAASRIVSDCGNFAATHSEIPWV